jgi:hypothetical protein
VGPRLLAVVCIAVGCGLARGFILALGALRRPDDAAPDGRRHVRLKQALLATAMGAGVVGFIAFGSYVWRHPGRPDIDPRSDSALLTVAVGGMFGAGALFWAWMLWGGDEEDHGAEHSQEGSDEEGNGAEQR